MILQNSPCSTLVCGVQGSGKSHTVSVLLENLFVPDLPSIGSCKRPLSGLVFHYSEGGSGARPCEAAWVACAKANDTCTPSVRVYVSESSYATMKKVYEPLGKNVKVRRLKFVQSELDAQAVMSMMAIGSSDSAPLYMHTLLSIMRELGEQFDLSEFRRMIDEAKRKMNPNQRAGLEQRLALLDAFVDDREGRKSSLFKEGFLTIVDLSDPFIDPGSACSLFEIATRLFVRAELSTGKVLVVDEAHKYLSANHSESGLTKALTTLIREQRHLGMRVIISTQEPTAVPPVLIDLCNIVIFHRFSSPAWWDAVARRVCADVSSTEGFERVMNLKTGQALILCPSGLCLFSTTTTTVSGTVVKWKPKLAQLGRRYMIIKTRQRVTVDGGASIMALDT
ncbi:P-loop containing nucleoside triphosphate hydrolase protein [Cerioporus squamosus]|nr:P-loop containing nucleoside triphosphate hydrolase protein [Cerioporus squamosus]